MRPGSPTEVVELARRHLSLERPFVVARAIELEPDQDRRRDPAQLQALWQDLLQHARNVPAEPPPASASPSAPGESASTSLSGSVDLESASTSLSGSVDLESASASLSGSVDPASPSPPAGAPGTDTQVAQTQDRPEPASLPGDRSEPQSGVPAPAGPTAGADAAVSLPRDEPVPGGRSESQPEARSLPGDRSAPQAGVASQSGPPPPAEPDYGFGSPDLDDEMAGFDLAELHALDEAPSHAHDIEQKIKSVFPGTEFAMLPDPDDDPGESVT